MIALQLLFFYAEIITGQKKVNCTTGVRQFLFSFWVSGSTEWELKKDKKRFLSKKTVKLSSFWSNCKAKSKLNEGNMDHAHVNSVTKIRPLLLNSRNEYPCFFVYIYWAWAVELYYQIKSIMAHRADSLSLSCCKYIILFWPQMLILDNK